MSTPVFVSDHVDSLVLGHSVSLPRLMTLLEPDYQLQRYRDACVLLGERGVAVVFDYGVLVAWGMNGATRQHLKDSIASLVERPDSEHGWDSLRFSVGSAASVGNDHLVLPDCEPLTLVAASHALAQSEKLDTLEVLAQHTLFEHGALAKELASSGRISVSRKALARIRGEMFVTKNDIMLHFGLLDTPEFFWDHPEHEGLYQMVARYLDLKPRVELLNLKLATISELLDMLAAEQNHQHSSLLEWIIILLIAVEIVIFFYEKLSH